MFARPPFARLKLIIIQFWKVNEILRATGKYPAKMLQRDFCYVPFLESIMCTDIVCFLASRKHSGGVLFIFIVLLYVSVYFCVHFWRWKEMHQAKRSFIVSTKIVTHAEENKFEKFRIVRSISVNKTCCMMLHDDTSNSKYLENGVHKTERKFHRGYTEKKRCARSHSNTKLVK